MELSGKSKPGYFLLLISDVRETILFSPSLVFFEPSFSTYSAFCAYIFILSAFFYNWLLSNIFLGLNEFSY